MYSIKKNCFIIENGKQYTKEEYFEYQKTKVKPIEKNLTNEDWFAIYKKGANRIFDYEKYINKFCSK